jgi:hypothetical protein
MAEEFERPLKTKRKPKVGADVVSDDEHIARFASINTDASGHKRVVSE